MKLYHLFLFIYFFGHWSKFTSISVLYLQILTLSFKNIVLYSSYLQFLSDPYDCIYVQFFSTSRYGNATFTKKISKAFKYITLVRPKLNF